MTFVSSNGNDSLWNDILAPDLSYFSMYLMTFLLYSILTLWPLFSMMSVYCLCAMDWRFKTFVVLEYLQSA